ncbi:MAG: hypothetical protein HY540_08435 [Deltaproteobacteria bacterium]|nr:hypothetical protein [Deltaproteobacteria bacterium]
MSTPLSPRFRSPFGCSLAVSVAAASAATQVVTYDDAADAVDPMVTDIREGELVRAHGIRVGTYAPSAVGLVSLPAVLFFCRRPPGPPPPPEPASTTPVTPAALMVALGAAALVAAGAPAIGAAAGAAAVVALGFALFSPSTHSTPELT